MVPRWESRRPPASLPLAAAPTVLFALPERARSALTPITFTNGTTLQTTGTGLPATVNSLTITNAANFPTNFVTLANSVTVSGATTISDGTLALGPTSTLVAGSSLNIAAGATFDVSGLGASATYSFGGSATLVANGTNTVVGVSAAAIIGGASGTVSLGSQPVTLTYDGSHPALYISQGTLSLNGNAFIVNTAAFTVIAGAAATLMLTSGNSQSGLGLASLASPLVVTVTDANGNPVSGTSVTFAIATVPGSATGQSLSATNTTTAANGQASSTLTLGNTVGTYTVTATSTGLSNSPVTFTATATGNLAITSFNGGVNPTAGTAFSIVVQAQSASGTPVNLLTDTTVTISRTTGTGTLGGQLLRQIRNWRARSPLMVGVVAEGGRPDQDTVGGAAEQGHQEAVGGAVEADRHGALPSALARSEEHT